MTNKNIYLIATPIGNIDDISLEAIKLFHEADLIICEDTRKIKYILNYHKITAPKHFFIINKFNENKESTILNLYAKLSASEIIVWVSDAGYPMICDPGYKVKKNLEINYNFKIISGPSSIMHALLISGMPTYPFYFAGFLNPKKITQSNQLKQIKENIFCTIVIFESVHRVEKLINNILEVFGDIDLCICREISKTYETIYHNKISILQNSEINLKGEFVFVFQNKKS